MTPEQLKKGSELAREIKNQGYPLEEIDEPTKSFGHTDIIISNGNNSNGSVRFKLTKPQIDIVKVLVVSMARENIGKLKNEFSEL